MSASGHSATSRDGRVMSALPPIVLQKSPSGVCGIGICNNRIRRRAFLNLCYTLERDLESIFRAGMLKIVLQQYRPQADIDANYNLPTKTPAH
jgi:hypothetical protein